MQKRVVIFTNKPVLFYVGLGLSGFAALLSLIVATVYGACYAHSVITAVGGGTSHSGAGFSLRRYGKGFLQ